jgi:hypothetical protein
MNCWEFMALHPWLTVWLSMMAVAAIVGAAEAFGRNRKP